MPDSSILDDLKTFLAEQKAKAEASAPPTEAKASPSVLPELKEHLANVAQEDQQAIEAGTNEPPKKGKKKSVLPELKAFLGEADLGSQLPPEIEDGAPGHDTKGDKMLSAVEKQFYDTELAKHEEVIEDLMIAVAGSRETGNASYAGQAVILVGEPGVGKSILVEKAAAKEGLEIAIFNAANVDPFLHFVGIPTIIDDPSSAAFKKKLKFFRSDILDTVELLFLDEINRIPTQTQNALFEIVHSRKVNGKKIPMLKAVWMAMNPANAANANRKVEHLQDAFGQRIVNKVTVIADPRIHHYVFEKSGISERVARVCLRWWYRLIKDKEPVQGGPPASSVVNPRVLGYIMTTIQSAEDRRDDPKRPITAKRWTQLVHSALETKDLMEYTAGVKLPIEELLMEFEKGQMPHIDELKNDNPEIADVIARIEADPTKGKAATEAIIDAFRKDSVSGTKPLYGPNLIGKFSKVLLSKNFAEDACAIITSDRAIANYLYMKAGIPKELKATKIPVQFHKHCMADPTPDELAIYQRFEGSIRLQLTAHNNAVGR